MCQIIVFVDLAAYCIYASAFFSLSLSEMQFVEYSDLIAKTREVTVVSGIIEYN